MEITMKPVIYLDMDGVLCDFFTPVLRLFEVNRLPAQRPLVYDIVPWINQVREENMFYTPLSDKEIYDTIQNHPDFWHKLPQYSHTQELIGMCLSYGEVYVNSWPQPYASCYEEKFRWLRDNTTISPSKFILMKDKHLLAKPNTILIDDCPSNIEKFINCSGKTITFPQPWNCNHDVTDKMDYVFNELQQHLDAINNEY
jgi:5'(3')-deoxyribonucleotidase